MRKLLSIIAALSFVSAAHAESNFTSRLKEGSDSLRLLVGGSQGSFNTGLDYERRAGSGGLGMFILQTSKRTIESANPNPGQVQTLAVSSRPETWNLGFTAPLHLVDHSNFDVYIAPAITAIYVKDVPMSTLAGDNKDVLTFGPALKVGTVYYFHSNLSAGLDVMTITNWTNDRVAGDRTFANLALGYTW